MPKIIFIDETHQYFTEDRSIEYKPVSYVVEPYIEEFNTRHWTTVEAFKLLCGSKEAYKLFSKGFDVKTEAFLEHGKKVFGENLVEQIRADAEQEWEENGENSSRKGTFYHAERERMVFERGYDINPFDGRRYKAIKYDKQYDNQSLADNLWDLPDGCYPEMLIFSEWYRTAGQEDRVFIETKGRVRYIDCDDYKTDAVIKNFSYGRKMKPPLDHIDDHKFNLYQMKVSSYGLMLEDFGFVVRNMSLHNFNKMHKLRYLKNEARLILDELKAKES